MIGVPLIGPGDGPAGVSEFGEEGFDQGVSEFG